MGLLIGRRGETLTALQLMLNMLVSRKLKRRTTVTVDVEGYRRRREDDLTRMAQRIAGQVKSNGQPFTFEPMQSRERRLIHIALANDTRVMTESTGDGDQRRVVVMLRPGAGVQDASESRARRGPPRSRGPRTGPTTQARTPVLDSDDDEEFEETNGLPLDSTGMPADTAHESPRGSEEDERIDAQDKPSDVPQDRP
jgi:hypothetical protein